MHTGPGSTSECQYQTVPALPPWLNWSSRPRVLLLFPPSSLRPFRPRLRYCRLWPHRRVPTHLRRSRGRWCCCLRRRPRTMRTTIPLRRSRHRRRRPGHQKRRKTVGRGSRNYYSKMRKMKRMRQLPLPWRTQWKAWWSRHTLPWNSGALSRHREARKTHPLPSPQRERERITQFPTSLLYQDYFY